MIERKSCIRRNSWIKMSISYSVVDFLLICLFSSSIYWCIVFYSINLCALWFTYLFLCSFSDWCIFLLFSYYFIRSYFFIFSKNWCMYKDRYIYMWYIHTHIFLTQLNLNLFEPTWPHLNHSTRPIRPPQPTRPLRPYRLVKGRLVKNFRVTNM